MFRLSNELIMITEEITWKRNHLLKKLYELESSVAELEKNDKLTDKKEVKKIAENMMKNIKESLEILEDIDEDDYD